MAKKKACVILPVYNERDGIRDTYEKVRSFRMKNPHFSFIFVDDGSTDNTKMVLKEVVKHRGISMISYSRNMGKEHAIKRGVEEAESDFICFLDSDMAYSLDYLKDMHSLLGEYDIVIGNRNLVPDNVKKAKFSRVFFGRAFSMMSRVLLNMRHTDTQAGIKGFSARVARDLFSRQTITDFSFDVELLYLASKLGYSVKEMPVHVSERHISMVSNVNIARDSARMFASLIKIRFNDLVGRYGKKG